MTHKYCNRGFIYCKIIFSEYVDYMKLSFTHCKTLSLSVNYSFHFYVWRVGLLTNLSFLSPFPSQHFLYFFLWPTRCCLLPSSRTFFFVCRSCCRCYTTRLHLLYYRRRSCRSTSENCAERKRKKKSKLKSIDQLYPCT